ncbi:D-alanine-D-alanine ligase [Dyadobacter sp. BE34]|uniref:D-alanine--D-alanine ligase n=1 Tax=Dyadobacter fermentans TaxID=94254 RepID=A0ABU1QS24_9BACT|nr:MULTISPECIES: D-alanine--D-alanine ligase [Dyadobacter]MDR6803939.1 D-alanine-D-alanine ligase [Dyadobacter fermentans]MDR7041679.1 D-alanine-D-alanine ligase [Dyadobacter sp. BE242]MDR7196082.1 D-alanine-D-alanine ligase [Dyadobacter sp. BE34]MDR7213373.1 D-alanine-D-alanine ligase [Dyadobacter sp. BE31]MDR7261488.1 D-alanine-D-alanine ligase [Dyadobacter sp. BE32]
MRIGIFFGGPSREREISFAGGKTAFEYLDKSLFEPVPVFVDSFGRFILLQKELMYSSEIREFYPAPGIQKDGFKTYIESFPELAAAGVSAEIGKLISPLEFKEHFDFAFLAMHGPDCEDGAIQGLLEWYKIPYSGPGLMGSAVGIDKILQNEMIALVNGQEKKSWTLKYSQWVPKDYPLLFQVLKKHLGLPLVIKAPHQGSSIGVAIVKEDSLEEFVSAVNQCFFQIELDTETWKELDEAEKLAWGQKIANLDEGIGFPVILDGKTIYHPTTLISELEIYFSEGNDHALLSSSNAEDQVLVEEFVNGQEFSCGCIQFDDGSPLALPPSEVIKMVKVFDFNAKYKPGASRKRIPVDTTLEKNQEIQQMIAATFQQLGINACVRIDGFLTENGTILLHDPNTIPGMSPTSFIFKQMAEIGLNVTQALTYLVRQSLRERIRTGKHTWALRALLEKLDERIAANVATEKPVEHIVFDATDEAYVEARRRYGLLNAGGKVAPVPVLKAADGQFYQLPNPLMFKEYVSDVEDLLHADRHPLLVETSQKAAALTHFFAGDVSYDIIRIDNPVL